MCEGSTLPACDPLRPFQPVELRVCNEIPNPVAYRLVGPPWEGWQQRCHRASGTADERRQRVEPFLFQWTFGGWHEFA